MAKKKSFLTKLLEKKCNSCGKSIPKNKSHTLHHVQMADGTWKQVCASCKGTYGGRTTKPMFSKGGWGH